LKITFFQNKFNPQREIFVLLNEVEKWAKADVKSIKGLLSQTIIFISTTNNISCFFINSFITHALLYVSLGLLRNITNERKSLFLLFFSIIL